MIIKDFFQFYFELLFICVPFIVIPIMISLTKGLPLKEKRKTGSLAVLTAAVVLIGSLWSGSFLLNLLDIRIASFQVAGGVIIFLLALSMLRDEKQSFKEKGKACTSIAIVPLAIPLMAGPGSISSVVVASTEFPGLHSHLILTLDIILVSLSLWVFLYFGAFLERSLGKTGLLIISKLSGIVLCTIGVEILAKGAIGLFPSLGL